MDPLYIAVFLIAAIAFAHSYLGERYILIRLFRREDLPRLFGSSEFTVRTLRFAWHITSIAWLGLAGILLLAAHPPVTTQGVGIVVGITFLAHSAFAFGGSRGKHYSWIVFLAIGAIAIFATPRRGLDSGEDVNINAASPRSSDILIDYLPALKGEYFQVASEATGRNYHIYIRLPEGYDSRTSGRYPVVYLLDGDSLFPLLAPTHLFLTHDEQLPEAVIVGISYGGFDPSVNKRHIDFSGPAADAPPGEDGAPDFLSFLENELLPTVEGRYNIDPSKRVLLGQSRGGYFVLWSALEAPDLFWGRIASNPSFTPGHTRFFADVAPHHRSDLKVVLASGSRDTALRKHNAVEWAQAWQSHADAPWQVTLLVIQGGTHAASIGEAYRQAMLWLFREAVATTTTDR